MTPPDPERFSLKDQLFNRPKVEALAARLRAAHRRFKAKEFSESVLADFPHLELKQRITRIRVGLEEYLPGDYTRAVGILLDALPEPCDPDRGDEDFGEFIYAPIADYVAARGCTDSRLIFSLGALREITTRCSAEYAIRPFINAFPDQTLAMLRQWTDDPHYHVRRLVSEGTRPKLPWAPAITIRWEQVKPLLEKLHDDPTRFVTRSVANHLNDWSKSHPEMVLDFLAARRGRQRAEESAYITRHALRTLSRHGHPGALRVLGIDPAADVEVRWLAHSRRVHLGGAMEFSVEICARRDVEVMIDYRIGFQGAKGSGLRHKIFKLTRLRLTAGEPKRISKSHVLKPMSTRALYPGPHSLALQINGKLLPAREFVLVM